jgi:prophage antirepressor-like protein
MPEQMTCGEIDKSIRRDLPKEGKVKVEVWNGLNVHFIYHNDNWWIRAADISDEFGYGQPHDMVKYLDEDEVSVCRISHNALYPSIVEANSLQDKENENRLKDTFSMSSEVKRIREKTAFKRKTEACQLVSEQGAYHAFFVSNKPEAKPFRKWLLNMLVEIRKSAGLSQTQLFRVFDVDFQKTMTKRLKEGLELAKKVSYMKVNMIANKAVSNVYDFPKAVKKENMSQEMLVLRQEILDKTTALMIMKDEMDLSLSVSDTIYKKYSKKVGN